MEMERLPFRSKGGVSPGGKEKLFWKGGKSRGDLSTYVPCLLKKGGELKKGIFYYQQEGENWRGGAGR